MQESTPHPGLRPDEVAHQGKTPCFVILRQRI